MVLAGGAAAAVSGLAPSPPVYLMQAAAAVAVALPVALAGAKAVLGVWHPAGIMHYLHNVKFVHQHESVVITCQHSSCAACRAGDSLHIEWHDGRLHVERALVDHATGRAEVEVSHALHGNIRCGALSDLPMSITVGNWAHHRSDQQQMAAATELLLLRPLHKGHSWQSTRANCCQRRSTGGDTHLEWCAEAKLQ